MKETLNGKYLTIAALVSLTILAVGVRYRPRKTDIEAPSAVEIAMLQQIVKRDQATAITQYLGARASELADQVVFVAANGASGVRYMAPNQVLTVGGRGALVEPTLILAEIPTSIFPAPIGGAAQRGSGNWLLIVGRSSTEQLLWTASIEGSSHMSVCEGVDYQELVLNANLNASFAGAGIFDVDSNLVGVVMPCGGDLHTVAIESVPFIITVSSSNDRKFIEQFGFRTVRLTDKWRDLFPKLEGFLVMDVWAGGWADRVGLTPGDLLVTDSQTLGATDLGGELRVSRPGRHGLFRMSGDVPAASKIALLADPSQPELFIEPGSAAARAGLRSGDRLVSIVDAADNSIVTLEKLLASSPSTPVRIVYQRGRRRSLLEVPHE